MPHMRTNMDEQNEAHRYSWIYRFVDTYSRTLWYNLRQILHGLHKRSPQPCESIGGVGWYIIPYTCFLAVFQIFGLPHIINSGFMQLYEYIPLWSDINTNGPKTSETYSWIKISLTVVNKIPVALICHFGNMIREILTVSSYYYII